MHIVVAGASGATGRHVVRQAVAADHRVTALVRESPRLTLPGAEIRITDPVADKQLALPPDADAVISCLGMRPAQPSVPVCEPGTSNLVDAMLRAGIPRIVVTSAVPAHTSGGGEPLWFRLVRTLVRRRSPHIYDDIDAMERVLRATGDDIAWTIVRPGYLTEDAASEYRLLPERNATTSVAREDLAHALLALALDDGAAGRSYGLRRGALRPSETRR